MLLASCDVYGEVPWSGTEGIKDRSKNSQSTKQALNIAPLAVNAEVGMAVKLIQ